MKLRRTLLLAILAILVLFGPSTLSANEGAGNPPCVPFRLYRGAEDPTPWVPKRGQSSAESVKAITKQMPSFPMALARWRDKHPAAGESVLAPWMDCLRHYALLDTDKDGRPDWKITVDDEPATVLFPDDADVDGDGADNVLDAHPWRGSAEDRPSGTSLPAHLRLTDPEAVRWQETLWQKHQVIALDHTDFHGARHLEALNRLLTLLPGPAPFRLFYAFARHDGKDDIAAYHREADAISIGGRLSYLAEEGGNEKVLGALAHELGHAWLFRHLTPAELAQTANKYGGWNCDGAAATWYDPSLFRRHSHSAEIRSSRASGARWSMGSAYSATNAHEWFAEGFAGTLLAQLTDLKTGAKQPASITAEPKFWTDYANVSEAFRAWLESQLKRRASPGL